MIPGNLGFVVVLDYCMQVRTCRQGIVDYFTNFLQLKPYGTIDKCIIRELAPDVAINSGIYTFKLTRPTGGWFHVLSFNKSWPTGSAGRTSSSLHILGQ